MKERILSLAAVGIAAASLGIAVNQGNRADTLQKKVDMLQQNLDANFVGDCRNEALLNSALKRPIFGIEGCRQERTIWYKEAREKGVVDITGNLQRQPKPTEAVDIIIEK